MRGWTIAWSGGSGARRIPHARNDESTKQRTQNNGTQELRRQTMRRSVRGGAQASVSGRRLSPRVVKVRAPPHVYTTVVIVGVG